MKDNCALLGLRLPAALKCWKTGYLLTVQRGGKTAGSRGHYAGKLNMDEFAMGSSTENSSFYNENPWDTSRVPGGSAAVPRLQLLQVKQYTLGSDTGGLSGSLPHFAG